VNFRHLTQFVHQTFHHYIEPLFIAARKSRRLSEYGIIDHRAIPIVVLDLSPKACDCLPECHSLITRYARYYAKFNQVHRHSMPHLNPLLGTAEVLELSGFKDCSAYDRALAKHSGNFRRSANKALKQGFYTKVFDKAAFSHDILVIQRSKKLRSFGPVLEAFLPAKHNRSPATQRADPGYKTKCPKHWEICFGVFHATTVATHHSRPEVLVGYAKLHRIGNTLRYAEKMGHGDYLNQGIMMLLQRELIHWLLDETNTLAKGIELLTYGALEQGSQGLAFWKKKALFRPCLLEFAAKDVGGGSPPTFLLAGKRQIRPR
jgi:hypothetical protein